MSDFKCELCNRMGSTTIQKHLTKLPRILVLHLKRYKFKSSVSCHENNLRLIKNDSEIKIPIFLTLNTLASTVAKPHNESLKEEPNYRLIGIVNHIGNSSTSGHYISDVYDIKNNKWSSFDDENTLNILEKKILTDRTKSGYVFFYINKYFSSKKF